MMRHAAAVVLVRLDVALRAVWRSNNFAYHKIAAAPHHRAVRRSIGSCFDISNLNVLFPAVVVFVI